MIKISNISISVDYSDSELMKKISKKLKCSEKEIKSFFLLKKSIDARKKNDIKFILTVAVKCFDEKKILKKNLKEKNISEYIPFDYKIPKAKKLEKSPVIAGFGPAGIFAAYILALGGHCPVVLERGSDVDRRIEDIEFFNKTGILKPESNVQFGEGGAGTFSDGKLNTGINDERIKFVLETFVKFGAAENILYDAKPHVGTDVLRKVIKNIRNEIISLGGEIKFNSKFYGFSEKNGRISAVKYISENKEYEVETDNFILSTGHSARDVFRLLKDKNFVLSQKNFSMGVRIEHLQKDINKAMFGYFSENKNIIPAAYKQAVHLKNGRGVYTFCMCPGGYVVASASENGRLVTNGMSYSKRDGINANSALLVGIDPKDLKSEDVLAGVYLQEKTEELAFTAGGSDYKAPVIKTGDFLNKKCTDSFGKVLPTYPIGTRFAEPENYLPEFITESLREGIVEIGKKMKGFDSYDSVLTGVESRSTSPVRIERDEKRQALTLKGFYPCGEGAGYAGGIMSAAVDGIKCAEMITTENQL